MTKRFLIMILCGIIFSTNYTVFAENDKNAIPLEFEKTGGGKFIYCNNPEAIQKEHLSTTENPKPTYLMSNKGLKPGNYSMFISNYNYAGFDIEVDVEFLSQTNAEIKVTAVGFCVPDNNEFWDCIDTWADYKDIPIRTINGYNEYLPYKGTKPTFDKFVLNEDKKSEWLSTYIYNYSVIPPRKCFNTLVDFTIISGEADVNIAALKSYGTLKDRSKHSVSAAPGEYVRDNTHKGVADTLPLVETKLDINIDNTIKNGDKIPVTVFNQYFPEGNTVTDWMTNINPSSDMYMQSKYMATSSDMLELNYVDDEKLKYYGVKVKKEDRDNIWRFDLYHTNTKEYEPNIGVAKDNYIPNDIIKPDINNLPDIRFQNSLGNYGVTTRYKLNLTNSDKVERTLNYALKTTSSNIIIVRNEKGEPLNPYTFDKSGEIFALCKGINWPQKEDNMINISLKAGEKKNIILDVILPTNTMGGIINSLTVDKTKYTKPVASVPLGSYDEMPPYKDVIWTGQEYLKWKGTNLHRLVDDEWQEIEIPKKTQEMFDEWAGAYSFKSFNDGYIAKFGAWDNLYGAIDEKQNKDTIYFFDGEFNFLKEHSFDTYVESVSITDGKIYVVAGKKYLYRDSIGWITLDNSFTIPISSGHNVIAEQGGTVYIANDSAAYTPISYESRHVSNIKTVGNLYYYRRWWKNMYTDTYTPNALSFSKDAIHWIDMVYPNQLFNIREVYPYDDTIYIDCKYKTFEESLSYIDQCIEKLFADSIYIELNGSILSFENPPQIREDRTLVPIRFLFEKLNATVDWNEETNEATIIKGENEIVFQIDNNEATVNGEVQYMDVPAYLIDDRTMVPLRFLAEGLGYDVEWNERDNLVIIKM